MALSPLIEYLKALERPGGGHLCQHGASQAIIPILPAGFRVIVDMVPPTNIYATIIFHAGWAGMLPHAWEKSWFSSGAAVFSATLTQNYIDFGIDTFVIVTDSLPVHVELENVSPVNQYYEHNYMLLTIPTLEDLNLLREAIRGYANTPIDLGVTRGLGPVAK